MHVGEIYFLKSSKEEERTDSIQLVNSNRFVPGYPILILFLDFIAKN